jgi:hypothetical protein
MRAATRHFSVRVNSRALEKFGRIGVLLNPAVDAFRDVHHYRCHATDYPRALAAQMVAL